MRAGERKLTFALFLHSFFAVGFVTAGRSARDALFLSHFGSAQLFWMYLTSAAAVAGVGLAYSPWIRRLRRDRAAQGGAAVFAAVMAAAWVFTGQEGSGVYAALYVAVEVVSALLLIQFWTLAGELFHARDAKRLYGLIGSVVMLANVVVGLATARMAHAFGTRSVLLLGVGLLLGAAGAAVGTGRWGRQRLLARAVGTRGEGGRRTPSSGTDRFAYSPHLRGVALLTAITFFTTTVVDFEFKAVAGRSLSVDGLTAFFGYLSFSIGLLALVLQLFGTGRLLQRLGVIGALTVLPLGLAAGNLGLALWPTLLAAAWTKGADSLFRYSINDATTQILYLPLPPRERAQAKAFIDGVVKPVAIAAAGAALGVYTRAGGTQIQPLAWLALGLSGAWLALVFTLRSTYLGSLRDVFRRPGGQGASADFREQATHQALELALSSASARDVLNILDLLPEGSSAALYARVESLLDHEDGRVRAAALVHLGRRGEIRSANAVFRMFEDPLAEVRAAAVNAFCLIGRDKAVRSVKPLLQADEPEVRAAAVTGMIRYGGLDGVLTAAEALKGLIAHAEPRMREHAAKVLGAIAVQNFYQPVLELMNDEDPAVRSAAMAAAGAVRSPEFVLPLMYRTQRPREGRGAVTALAGFGISILPMLDRVLSHGSEQQAVRLGAARVLGRMIHPEALEVTLRHVSEPDDEVRGQLYRALVRAGRGRRLSSAQQRQVHEALRLELRRARRTLAAAEALSLAERFPQPAPAGGVEGAKALLGSALTEALARSERRVFTLLAVLYPEADLELIAFGIRDAQDAETRRRRATAVELLDTLLPRALRQEVLPLLEDAPRSDRLRAWEAAVPSGSVPSAGDTLRELCQDSSPWVRACALHYAAQAEAAHADDLLAAGLSDGHAWVREAALFGTARLSPDRAAELARAHQADESALIRSWSAWALSDRGAAAGSRL